MPPRIVIPAVLLGAAIFGPVNATMQWKGKWIWFDGEDKPRNFYLFVRKTVELNSVPKEATCRVSADSRYKLYVNGWLIGRGPVRSDPRWQHYEQYDLARYLREGKNTIAALVHHYGEPTFQYHLGRGGFLFDSELVSSDETWRVMPADAWQRDLQRMDVQLGFPEILDLNRVPEGWKEPSFDDSTWQFAKVIGPVGTEPWTGMAAPEIPHLVEEFIYPREILEVGTWDASDVSMEDATNIALLMSSEKRQAASKQPSGQDRRFPPPGIDELLQSGVFKPGGAALAGWEAGSPMRLLLLPAGTRRPSKKMPRLPVYRNFEPDPEILGCRKVAVHPRKALESASKAEGPGPERMPSEILLPGAAGAKTGPYVSIDFGREVVGYPILCVQTEKGGILDMGYSEILADGKVDPHRGGVRYADRFILKPGAQTIETFDKRAFRYMQIDLRECSGAVEISLIGLKFSTYPVEWQGCFESSDRRLNDIWKLGAYTVQLNMEDGYTDCPWRERAQWWGDARVEALINYYAFGDTRLIRKGIRDIARSQKPDGITACFAPGDLGPCPPIPSFTLIWVLSIWDYYLWSGDIHLLEEVYPNVEKALRFFEDHADEHGLAKDLPYWMFIDWEKLDLRSTVTSLNCFYYAALRDAARIAAAIHRGNDAHKYTEMAERVKKGINELLFDPEKGVYVDCLADGEKSSVISQQSNSLAVLYEIAPPERVSGILDYIHTPGKEVVQAGSPYFSFYILQALWKSGRGLQALKYIRERWGAMLDAGATTAWEVWNQGASLCHGWSGGPTHDLPAHIAGIRPLEPGCARMLIAPEPLDLRYVKAVVPTVKGQVTAEYLREAGLKLRVVVPEACKARIVVPDPVEENRIRFAGPAPLSTDVTSEGKPVFEVGPGKYLIEYKDFQVAAALRTED